MRKSIFAVLAVTALAGCATIIDKPYQDIAVVTPGVVGADCVLETPNNTYRAITPQNIKIERTHDSLYITCERAGYYTAKMNVVPEFRAGSTMLNIFNGIIPGVAYDIANESIHEFPHQIIVPLEEDPEAMAALAVEEEPPAPLPRRKDEGREMPFVYKPVPDPVPSGESFSDVMKK